jgi:hypothetical protein
MHKKFYSGKLKRGDRLGDLCVSGKGNIYFSIYVCIYLFIAYLHQWLRLDNIDW